MTADQRISHPFPLLNDSMHLKILKKMSSINLSLALRLLFLMYTFLDNIKWSFAWTNFLIIVCKMLRGLTSLIISFWELFACWVVWQIICTIFLKRISYLTDYCRALFFRYQMKNEFNSSQFISVSFDEALNKKNANLSDGYSTSILEKRGKNSYEYWDSIFFGKTTHAKQN